MKSETMPIKELRKSLLSGVSSTNGKMSLYTSGSIEYAGDPFWWRNILRKSLGRRYNVIIPMSMKSEYSKEDPRYRTWVKETFVIPDMNCVRDCEHFFIQICETTFKGMGTPSELSLAAWLGKPIVAWIDNVNLGTIPGWTLGCLDGATLVSSLDEAVEHYKMLDNNVKAHRRGLDKLAKGVSVRVR